jgi:hypothetical protein
MQYLIERHGQFVTIVSEWMLIAQPTHLVQWQPVHGFNEVVGAINFLNAEAAAVSVNTMNGFKVSRHIS